MEVLLDDHVLYGIHSGLQQSGVRGVGIVNIDLTVRYPVDATESICEIPGGRIKVGIRAAEIGEVF